MHNHFIQELQDAIGNRSADRRVTTLRKVTDLFLDQGSRLGLAQILKVLRLPDCHLVGHLAPVDLAHKKVREEAGRESRETTRPPLTAAAWVGRCRLDRRAAR